MGLTLHVPTVQQLGLGGSLNTEYVQKKPHWREPVPKTTETEPHRRSTPLLLYGSESLKKDTPLVSYYSRGRRLHYTRREGGK